MRDDESRGRGRRRKPRRQLDFEDAQDDFDDDDDDDRPARRRGRSRREPAKRRRGGGLFGRGGGRDRDRDRGRGRGRGRFDDLDDDDRDDYDDDYDDRRSAKSRRRKGRDESKPRTLLDLCTPVFGAAAMLPADAEGTHPTYQQFREQVQTSLNQIQSDAEDLGIEAEDARQAGYALCVFMDSAVAGSAWNAREQWSVEPLHIMLHQDPEAGVNFFRRLEAFDDRQKAVKEVFLVCLALGFRGRYAEMEPTEQAAEIGRIKQEIVRGIHPTPIEKQQELFPDAYREAHVIEDDVPPPPRWWLWASLGTVALTFLIWLLLFWWAGNTPSPAREALAPLVSQALETPAGTRAS